MLPSTNDALSRRTRHLVLKPNNLHAGMFLLGCVYKFCTFHKCLRLLLYIGEHGRKWVQCTPAIAVGWNDYRWSVKELLVFKVLLAGWSPQVRRGRLKSRGYHC
jgi:hypothetical protein